MRKILVVLLISVLVFCTNVSTYAATLTKEETTRLSSGVKWRQQTLKGSNVTQVVNTLVMEVNDPHTTIELVYPPGLNSLARTSELALQHHREGHQIIGSINASFFDTAGKGPVNLIVHNNQLLYPGIFTLTNNSPTYGQVAFGLDRNGNYQIANYDFSVKIKVNGKEFNITKINQDRKENDAVIYMAPYSSSRQNEWGTEISIAPAPGTPQPLELGAAIKGTVANVTGIGQGGNMAVPQGGFVLSVHGAEWQEKLAGIQPNDDVEVIVSINPVWQQAKYIIGSGPRLVKDGQISISMNEKTSFASRREPRTAIGINKEGTAVYFVTVDGRQAGYSNGMTIRELAEYMKNMGAYQALNLDGGGSTTMVARPLGEANPKVINRPSDGGERRILTALHAVSTAPFAEPKTIKLSIPDGKIIKGTAITVDVEYMLDRYYNSVPFNKDEVRYDVTNQIGIAEGNKITTTETGSGKIIATYQNAVGEVALTVVDTFDDLKANVENIVIGKGQSTNITVTPIDKSGATLLYDPSLVSWSVEGKIGTITENGTFTAGNENATGYVVATLGKVTKKIPVTVEAADAILIDDFETIDSWSAAAARSKASIARASGSEPARNGKSSLKLNYDFTTGEAGIKAAYVAAKHPIPLANRPVAIGMWVYGDGASHWLRGTIIDANGTNHTINFTEEGKLDWTGWKFVTAEIPANIAYPIKLDRIYVAEAVAEKQGKGTLYFDKLQALYSFDHKEPLFTDITEKHWAYPDIKQLFEQQIITGFTDGSFQPNASITRAQAAVMIAREQKLRLEQRPELTVTDVPKHHYAYKAIQALVDEGIMTGRTTTTFDPNAPLTRAEMATILQRTYRLQGDGELRFHDVAANHWALASIIALTENNITTGYEDGSFRPSNPTTRAEFSAFLSRVQQR